MTWKGVQHPKGPAKELVLLGSWLYCHQGHPSMGSQLLALQVGQGEGDCGMTVPCYTVTPQWLGSLYRPGG